MALSNYPDWNRLTGATVEIRRNGELIRTGTVDDVMPDSTALWLAADSSHPQAIYEAALHYPGLGRTSATERKQHLPHDFLDALPGP